jgi:hypothetical protein
MTTDLDVLLTESDPGRQMTIPSIGSPEFERLWAAITEEGTHRSVHHHRGGRRFLFPALSLGVFVVVLLLIIQLPTTGGHPSSSAAASLRSLAQVADVQAPVTPTGSQWLEQKVRASFNASNLKVGATPTPNASATVTANIDEWSNTNSITCTKSAFSSAHFATPANEQAWVAAGLLIQPATPAISCTLYLQPQAGAVAFDISSLPTDPTKLAHELEAGTTGIPALDQFPLGEAGNNPGFARAMVLLVGPTVGGSPSFWSALLNAIATMQGVSAIGTVTTHSGSRGLGFSVQTGLGRSVIVLSPSTGGLLEARNFEDASLQASDSAFANETDPTGIWSKGGSTRMVVNWLDPTSSPKLVDALPASVQQQGGPNATATGFIYAEPRAGVTMTQLSSFVERLRTLPGMPLWAFGGAGETETSFTVTMHGGGNGDLRRVVTVMERSGLFLHVHEGSR